MPADQPTILATSGGYRPAQRSRFEFAGLVHHAVELSGVTGRAPRVTVLGTASGDPRSMAAELSEAGRVAGFELSHLHLFPMPNVEDVEGHLLDQDVVWVNGGSVANLLAVWRVHGLDALFPHVWEAGVVLAGVSAGAICWFRESVTDSFGGLARLDDGLGFLDGSMCPHYDGEAQRRPTYHTLVAGGMTAGYAADDGCALHFVDGALREAVSSRPQAHGYRVKRAPDSAVVETPLPTRFLGAR